MSFLYTIICLDINYYTKYTAWYGCRNDDLTCTSCSTINKAIIKTVVDDPTFNPPHSLNTQGSKNDAGRPRGVLPY